MAATFDCTIRSLKTDGSRRKRRGLFLVTVVLGAWAAWFCLGRVSVYEVSETARLEVPSQARPVAALVPGRVVESRLVLGQQVEAGDVVVQLDDSTQRLALDEGRARLDDLRTRLEAVAKEIESGKQAAQAHQKAGLSVVAEHNARTAEARVGIKFAEEHLSRVVTLLSKQVVSKAEASEARSAVETKRAAVRTLEAGLTRVREKQKVEERDRQVELATLERERAELAGQIATQEAAVRRLVREVELRQVRAPVSGRVGQIDNSPVGTAVAAGQKLGCVVPEGKTRAVGYFRVASGGRVRAGQTARLRLDGFPWIQYGSIPATVACVASEPEGGLLRVEIELGTELNRQIPVEHGLPGSAEVLVERVSPAALVLRSVGCLLRSERPLEGQALAQVTR